jgi:hypothetical protein
VDAKLNQTAIIGVLMGKTLYLDLCVLRRWKMSRRMIKLTFLLGMFLALTVFSSGGSTCSTQKTGQTADQSKANSVTITGCLSKGDGENDYTITAADGKKYDLKSEKVALRSHVGHKVTVTGT